MSTTAQDVMSTYHRAWVGGRYDEAVVLLGPDLEVEVPINDYPTKDSFAKALRAFASRVDQVDVLSEMSSGDEAMILYDMAVRDLGTIRIVEHFTVSGGRIVRLRQVHDTALIRQGSSGAEETRHEVAAGPGFLTRVDVRARRRAVFEALTTTEGLAAWWTPLVQGSPTPGHRVELAFAGVDERIELAVVSAVEERSVLWECLENTGHPEWRGTTIAFGLKATGDEECVVEVHHAGLLPDLSCYEACRAGWHHFLRSIKAYVEEGQGMPFGAGVHRA